MFTSIIGSRTEKNNDANAVMIDSRHKSKSLMRPELNAAIQDLSNWIYRHALKDFDSFHDFPEEELNEYKVGSHALNFDVIKEKLGEDLSVSNFVECFIKLLKLLDDKHIANDIFHLTDTFVKRKKRFGEEDKRHYGSSVRVLYLEHAALDKGAPKAIELQRLSKRLIRGPY